MSISTKEEDGKIGLDDLDRFDDDLTRQEIIVKANRTIDTVDLDSWSQAFYPLGGQLDNDEVAELAYVRPMTFWGYIPGFDNAETSAEWDVTLRQNKGAFTQDDTGVEQLADPDVSSVTNKYTQNFGELDRHSVFAHNGRNDATNALAHSAMSADFGGYQDLNLREIGEHPYGPIFYPDSDDFLGVGTVINPRDTGGGTFYGMAAWSVYWDVYEVDDPQYRDVQVTL